MTKTKRSLIVCSLLLFVSGVLAAAELRLLFPRGGEILRMGTTVKISWEDGGDEGEAQIVLYKEGRYYADIGRAPAGAGVYTWRVPQGMPPAGDYTVRVRRGRAVDESDLNFFILPGAPGREEPIASPGHAYIPPLSDDLVMERFRDETGAEIMKVRLAGKPPAGFHAPEAVVTASAVLLKNVPAYRWSFGCSPTAAAMIAAYYDTHGYPNMYTGPTDSGYMPIDNSVWGTVVINGNTQDQTPLSATRMGLDGRTTRGHVDDYWIEYNSLDPDPFITNGWPQHESDDCVGDFMGSNQSSYGACDGGTLFQIYLDGSRMIPYNEREGAFGFREFMRYRGYPVTQCFTQFLKGYNGNSQGFTFDEYMDHINAGFPVMIHVGGHTMVGYGYDASTQTVYLHDTWDYADHQMTWDGTYAGMEMWGVTVLNLVPAPKRNLTITTTTGGTTDPAPGTHAYYISERAKVKSVPDPTYIFDGWTGCVTGTADPVAIQMENDESVEAHFRRILAPSASGQKIVNKSFSQVEYINIISWENNPANAGLDITAYRLYVMEGDSISYQLEFGANIGEYTHRKAGAAPRTYRITAVTKSGREGVAVEVTI